MSQATLPGRGEATPGFLAALSFLSENGGSELWGALTPSTPLAWVVFSQLQVAGLDQKILLVESHRSEPQRKGGGISNGIAAQAADKVSSPGLGSSNVVSPAKVLLGCSLCSQSSLRGHVIWPWGELAFLCRPPSGHPDLGSAVSVGLPGAGPFPSILQ